MSHLDQPKNGSCVLPAEEQRTLPSNTVYHTPHMQQFLIQNTSSHVLAEEGFFVKCRHRSRILTFVVGKPRPFESEEW